MRERCVPAEASVADTNHIPSGIVEEMRRVGLFGFAIPEEYGGMGLTLEEEVLVNFEVSQCSPVFRSIAGTNNGIGSMGIVIDGSEAQKRKYLPRLASGEIIGSFAWRSQVPAPMPVRCGRVHASKAITMSSTGPSVTSPTRPRRAYSR